MDRILTPVLKSDTLVLFTNISFEYVTQCLTTHSHQIHFCQIWAQSSK